MPIFIFLFLLIFSLVYFAIRKKAKQTAEAPGFAAVRFSDNMISEGGYDVLVKELYTKVRGVTFYDRQSIIRTKCRAGDVLWLVREPDNPKDINAIQVRRVLTNGQTYRLEEQLGYLSWELAQEIAPLLDAGMKGVAEITQITEHEACETEGVNLEVFISKHASEQPSPIATSNHGTRKARSPRTKKAKTPAGTSDSNRVVT